ncbi:hypothetical protein Acsp05_19910 [Actinokineospora sp. NBRC 105648]|nr:hypothetical protein Acsp05_19910 [Actinokineospora sp. NBRC 105648]
MDLVAAKLLPVAHDLDVCVHALRARRWHIVDGPPLPGAIGAILRWPGVLDVIILRADRTVAYRTPRHAKADPFRPAYVTDHYTGPALWVVRWLLTLEPPGSALRALRCPPVNLVTPE